MAIVRSLTMDRHAETIDNPGIARALDQWQERIDAARAEGAAQAQQAHQHQLTQLQQQLKQAAVEKDEAVQAAEDNWRQRWGQAIDALEAAHAELQALQARAMAEAEQDALSLALAVASRILRHEVEADPAWMRDILAQALDVVPRRRACTVRLHPQDIELAQEHMASVVQPGNQLPELQADPCLDRGGCLVESGGTLIDAGIAVSWERVAVELFRAVPVAVDPRPAPAEETGAVPEPQEDGSDAGADPGLEAEG